MIDVLAEARQAKQLNFFDKYTILSIYIEIYIYIHIICIILNTRIFCIITKC